MSKLLVFGSLVSAFSYSVVFINVISASRTFELSLFRLRKSLNAEVDHLYEKYTEIEDVSPEIIYFGSSPKDVAPEMNSELRHILASTWNYPILQFSKFVKELQTSK